MVSGLICGRSSQQAAGRPVPTHRHHCVLLTRLTLVSGKRRLHWPPQGRAGEQCASFMPGYPLSTVWAATQQTQLSCPYPLSAFIWNLRREVKVYFTRSQNPIACFLVHSKNWIFRKKIWKPKYSSQKIKFLIFGSSGQVWAAQFLTVKQHIFAPFFRLLLQYADIFKCSFSWNAVSLEHFQQRFFTVFNSQGFSLPGEQPRIQGGAVEMH